jgi:hypothetical protein
MHFNARQEFRDKRLASIPKINFLQLNATTGSPFCNFRLSWDFRVTKPKWADGEPRNTEHAENERVTDLIQSPTG